jgi:hypothetical protein
VNDVVPFFAVFPDPCTGELVTLTGNLHVLVHVTENAGGGTEMKAHFQPQGITGVGESGTMYQGTGVTQTMTENSAGPQVSSTLINNFRIISHGPSDNFTVHLTVHVTVNGNGELTAEVVDTRTECAG